ncbi:MAG: hypothetical protein COA78_38545 [Blastopirellula sp.]|nr:MAG: hypothetical protein COA78_38545 [Blastopirellula sp.]
MTKHAPRTSRRDALERGARRHNRQAREQMGNDATNWFVAFVPPQKEFIAQKILTRWGGHVYLPLALKWRRVNRYARAKQRIAYAAMPGCVFLGLAADDPRWYDLFLLDTVRGVLGLEGEPAALSGDGLHEFIERNRAKFTAPDEQKFMRTHHEFDVGDSVQIISGSFDGHTTKVEEITGRRAYFWLNLFGQITKCSVALDQLEKVS